MTFTPKQVRYHFGRIDRLRERLAMALNEAHHAGVIVYTDYKLESPCSTLWETGTRIEKTTEAALAEAMRSEIRSGKK